MNKTLLTLYIIFYGFLYLLFISNLLLTFSVFSDNNGGYLIGNLISTTNEGVAWTTEGLGIFLFLFSLFNLIFFSRLRKRTKESNIIKLSTIIIYASLCWFIFCFLYFIGTNVAQRK